MLATELMLTGLCASDSSFYFIYKFFALFPATGWSLRQEIYKISITEKVKAKIRLQHKNEKDEDVDYGDYRKMHSFKLHVYRVHTQC